MAGIKQEVLGRIMADITRRDSDALSLFRPTASQIPIIKTKSREVLVRGGNRSMKSTIAAAIVASVARGIALRGPDGKELPHFRKPGRPQLIWIIGYGQDHIGSTIHRLLFRPDAFGVVRDQKTGRVRAIRNWEERALGIEQGLVAPPFIPEDEIEQLSFEKKSSDHFDVCKLKNGTRIETYVSTGQVKMGDPVDLIWVDEDIEYPKYVNEWLARLPDKKGRFIWTAWPWTDNWALMGMHKRAEEQKDRKSPPPDVTEFKLSFLDNPFLDPEEKRKTMDAWGASGDEELKSRCDGEFSIARRLMYPNFSEVVHGCPRRNAHEPDKLEAFLAERDYVPPREWTRYLAFDPGHSTSAILFVAIPPPELGDWVVVYDELYLHGKDAREVALKVRTKVAGLAFQDFIIDHNYAQQTIPALGKTNLELYSNEWAALNLRSARSGTSFTFASNVIEAGLDCVRDWLSIRSDGTTKLRVIWRNVPHFIDEMTAYRKKFDKDEARDKPAGGQPDHLCDTLRYLAMHGCHYVLPGDPMSFLPEDPVFAAFQAEKTRRQPQKSEFPTFHCGAGSLAVAAH